MIFSAAVGAILGYMKFETPMALVLLFACLAARLVIDVRWDRMPIVGSRSPYTAYCRNLSNFGEPVEHAWISYGIQLMGFGLIAGMALYALVRYLV